MGLAETGVSARVVDLLSVIAVMSSCSAICTGPSTLSSSGGRVAERGGVSKRWAAHASACCLHVGRAENIEEELDLDLRTVQTAVLNLARSPLSFLDGRVGTAAAAALRFREAVSLALHP